MQRLAFEEVFAILSSLSSRTEQLAGLRAWLAFPVHPGGCLALIAQAAGTPP